MKPPFDPGLQLERSELSWRRTCLALGAASLVAMRLLPAVFGDALWTLGGAAGVALSTTLWIASRRRSRTMSAALDEQGDRARLPDGSLALALTIGLTACGVASLVVVLAAATAAFR
ncbi:DUF202 domain-containing protein [Microbacterium sp. LWO13-1.2]|uniref:DUF202 domain-containing protein n=1 Tax=Microbacterium sp. LWO13-1.2 TaxID=3135262 RepID=UPI003138A339